MPGVVCPSRGQNHLVSAMAQLERQQWKNYEAIGTKRSRICQSSLNQESRDTMDYSCCDNVEKRLAEMTYNRS